MYAKLGKVKCYEKIFYNPIFLYLHVSKWSHPPPPPPIWGQMEEEGVSRGGGAGSVLFLPFQLVQHAGQVTDGGRGAAGSRRGHTG